MILVLSLISILSRPKWDIYIRRRKKLLLYRPSSAVMQATDRCALSARQNCQRGLDPAVVDVLANCSWVSDRRQQWNDRQGMSLSVWSPVELSSIGMLTINSCSWGSRGSIMVTNWQSSVNRYKVMQSRIQCALWLNTNTVSLNFASTRCLIGSHAASELAFIGLYIDRESGFYELNFFFNSWILLNFKNAHWILFLNSVINFD